MTEFNGSKDDAVNGVVLNGMVINDTAITDSNSEVDERQIVDFFDTGSKMVP